MENPEGVLNLLDEFAKLKSKEIPNDLEEYLLYVAASGDTVYQWSLIKSLYRQKLINVITEFYENCPMMDIPACPNVDPFNYETMKNSLLERLDSFASAPFTIQRISELLTTPTKQYNRVDKFMRAIEKNIWVVSTREPGQREQVASQEASGNLVNGVAPRVRVTVKHPKRGKSIEERIKSGHPQLIDDDEEDEEEDESMETKTGSELMTNNDSEDTPLQCTSVKNLLEKYENGTIFCGAEVKTVQQEEPANAGETSSAAVPVAGGSGDIESISEHESDEEEVNIDKLVTSDESQKIESVPLNESHSLESDENKENSGNEIPIPLVEVVKENVNKIVNEHSPPESSSFNSETKPDTTGRTDDISKAEEDSVTVMEVLGLENEVENNSTIAILEEPDSEESVNERGTTEDKEKDKLNEAEVKGVITNEAEAARESEVCCEAEEKVKKDEDSDLTTLKKINSNTSVVGLEPDSSSSDDVNVDVPNLSQTIDFIVKEAQLDKETNDAEAQESNTSALSSDIPNIAETCTSTGFENFNKTSEFSRIEAELCLQSDLLETKMDENDLEEKSNEMIVEESEKMDEMDVDESNTSSPMVEEEVLEPMDESDTSHS